MTEKDSNSRLISERSRFLTLLTGTLELQLRLLHSTESDPGIIAGEHRTFAAFLDELAAHPQKPHVQQFSDMNQEEFLRAESDYLRQFSTTLQERRKLLLELLQVDEPDYAPRNTMAVLAERMAETRRGGWANQFTEAQRSTVVRLADAEQYYGKIIARRVFAGAAHQQAPETTRPATAAGAAPEAAGEPQPPDDMAASLLRIKASVMADRLDAYDGANRKVLATALLKLKQWIADPAFELIDARGQSLQAVLSRKRPGPALEVISSQPRDLLFVYHGRNGSRAVFQWGTSNATLQRLVGSSGLPLLTAPAVSLVLYTAGGDIAGSSWVASADRGSDGVEQLALLIKTLDFTREFMLLATPTVRGATSPASPDESEQELLSLAEEL